MHLVRTLSRLAPLALLLPAAAAAQTVPATLPASRAGLLVGLNSATVSTTADDADVRRRNGVVAGGYLTLPFARHFAFRPEVLYAQKGGSGRDDAARVALNIDYVEVPVLLQATVPTAGGVRPQLYAGPSLGIRARCELKVSGGGLSASAGCNENLRDGAGVGVRRFDVGGVVGGALAFDVGGRALTLGARYTHGFTGLVDDQDAGKNRVVAVYGSLEFPFGRRAR